MQPQAHFPRADALPESATNASAASGHLGLRSLSHFVYHCALVRRGPATPGITFSVQPCRVCLCVCLCLGQPPPVGEDRVQ